MADFTQDQVGAIKHEIDSLRRRERFLLSLLVTRGIDLASINANSTQVPALTTTEPMGIYAAGGNGAAVESVLKTSWDNAHSPIMQNANELITDIYAIDEDSSSCCCNLCGHIGREDEFDDWGGGTPTATATIGSSSSSSIGTKSDAKDSGSDEDPDFYLGAVGAGGYHPVSTGAGGAVLSSRHSQIHSSTAPVNHMPPDVDIELAQMTAASVQPTHTSYAHMAGADKSACSRLKNIIANSCPPVVHRLFRYAMLPSLSNFPFLRSALDRGGWLSMLLLFQSFSSIILASYVDLLKTHPTVVYFLTCLVGAGGNAGNQAAVRCIRGLAQRKLTSANTKRFILREVWMSLMLAGMLSFVGLFRAWMSPCSVVEMISVVVSLVTIVMVSVVFGAILPLLLQRVGVDPAHASTTIQVIMDILGVLITMIVTTAMLDSHVFAAMVKAFGSSETITDSLTDAPET